MIKKILFMMLFFITSIIASDINWAKDFHSGIEKAKKENKPVLFIISRDTCKYCIILDDTTLKDKKVVKALNSDFISIRSWTNEGDFIPTDIARNTPGLPGIWFLQSDGIPMFRPMLGYVEKNKFLEALAIVSTEFKKENKGNK